MRIAAFDLGSNSFHLVVCETRSDGSFIPLAREKEMLRLGDLVARTGYIGQEAGGRAIEVLARFRAVAEAQYADEIVAIGTAALREARDGVELVEKIREQTGIDIEVIDGIREARLIFLAISSSVVIDPAPALAADLGGGSLELMVGDRRKLLFAASVRLGVGRLTAELVSSDPLSRGDRKRLVERVKTELSPVMREIAPYYPAVFIGSSGTFGALARISAALRDKRVPDQLNQLTVSRADLDAMGKKLFELSNEERAKLPGCDARRAELLPAGFIVLDHLMDTLGLKSFTMSEWALREGIVLDAIGAHDRAELNGEPHAIRRASVLSLCRRMNWKQAHARHVAELSVAIFDATSELHHLDAVARELLELGGLLHDIGEHIARHDHDRHSAYLIENGDLRGFSPTEIRILVLLGRFHVRGTPKTSGELFDGLSEEERETVVMLASMLRIADALDASHSSLVNAVRLEHEDEDELVFVASARGEAELEQWSFRRKRELFEKTFSVSLELEIEHFGRSDYDTRTASGVVS